MAADKRTLLSAGTKVKTTKPNMEKQHEWAEDAWLSRRWGVRGTVLRHHDSHGLCYGVSHSSDGTVAYYDPTELEVIDE